MSYNTKYHFLHQLHQKQWNRKTSGFTGRCIGLREQLLVMRYETTVQGYGSLQLVNHLLFCSSFVSSRVVFVERPRDIVGKMMAIHNIGWVTVDWNLSWGVRPCWVQRSWCWDMFWHSRAVSSCFKEMRWVNVLHYFRGSIQWFAIQQEFSFIDKKQKVDLKLNIK